MRFLRFFLSLGCVLLLIALTACSDVFRPIAIPVFNPSGDPQVQQRAVVINNNNGGAGGAGSAMIVDAVADATLGVFPTGNNPVHAATVAGDTWIANQGDDTLTVINNFSSGGTLPTTVNLPKTSAPRFILAADSNRVYVANGNDTISSVSTLLLAVNTTVGIPGGGSGAVAMVETPDLKKIFCVNSNTNNVSVLNPDLSAAAPNIGVGSQPVAAALNADGSLLFVINRGDNTMSVIDTPTNAVVGTLPVGAQPTAIAFDRSLRRLYVVNNGDHSLSIFRADSGAPTLLKQLTLTGTGSVAITALANGTRVYVANMASNNVSVIDTASNTETRTIAVGTSPVSITSGGGSLRVLVANSGSNNITDIQTSNDTVIATLSASAPNPGYVFSVQ
jgi:YVTN family beta-propeller protein